MPGACSGHVYFLCWFPSVPSPPMTTRRDFMKLTAAAGTAAAVGVRAAETPRTIDPTATVGSAMAGTADRARWCATASKLATPLLSALAERRLRKDMPEQAPDIPLLSPTTKPYPEHAVGTRNKP